MSVRFLAVNGQNEVSISLVLFERLTIKKTRRIPGNVEKLFNMAIASHS